MIQLLKKLISHLYPLVITSEEGEITQYLEVRLEGGKNVLNSATVNYSCGSLYGVFKKVFNKYDFSNRNIENVLILGYGAGSVASLLRKNKQIFCPITGVEQDKVVIKLMKKYFNQDDYFPLELIQDDAFEFVMRTKDQYDLIVVDVFIEDKVPDKFKHPEFISKLNKLLSGNGILFFNKMVNTYDQVNKAEKVFSTLSEYLGETHIEKLRFNQKENWVYVFDRSTTNNNPLIQNILSDKKKSA